MCARSSTAGTRARGRCERPADVVERRCRTASRACTLASQHARRCRSRAARAGPPRAPLRAAASSLDLAGGRSRRHRRTTAAGRQLSLGTLREDPPLQIERREEVAVARPASRPCRATGRRVASAKWKRGGSAPASGVEVHERVAADEQVDARDRRVVNEVVAAEDHRPAKVLAEHEAPCRCARSSARAAPAAPPRPPWPCSSPAGLGQRVLVDVGRVDLHALAERLLAERLGEQHRERVGLLAGGAAGAPDADRLVAGFPRAGSAATRPQVVPRRLVAEERRDVDEERVEELRELLGMDLEIVEIIRVRVQPSVSMRRCKRRMRLVGL